MSPHRVESNGDSQQRWEDDGGAIPLDRSRTTTRAVLTLGKWKAANGGGVYTKSTHKARTKRVAMGNSERRSVMPWHAGIGLIKVSA
jgi:hypothetical protein